MITCVNEKKVMVKMLSVCAIKVGIVIDHIPAGQALAIMRLLAVVDHQQRVTLGLNLPSQRLGLKDLIKVENRKLSSEEMMQIAIFAPKATVNYIEHFNLQSKIVLTLPPNILGLFMCPRSNCITHVEDIPSHFRVMSRAKRVQLTCYYCEYQFDRDYVENSRQ